MCIVDNPLRLSPYTEGEACNILIVWSFGGKRYSKVELTKLYLRYVWIYLLKMGLSLEKLKLLYYHWLTRLLIRINHPETYYQRRKGWENSSIHRELPLLEQRARFAKPSSRDSKNRYSMVYTEELRDFTSSNRGRNTRRPLTTS